jgi:hypothetical protein
MNYDADTGQRRWLLKAVREAAGELFSQFSGLDESGLRWRPAEDEWCLKEVIAHLRDSDNLYRHQIELIAHNREPLLPDEALDILPSERNYRDEPLSELLNEYEAAREETVWLLRMLDEDDWDRCGIHPYRGRLSIHAIVRAIHEHDLEHLYQARRLHEAARSSFASARRRR